jgi:hypothetical protein
MCDDMLRSMCDVQYQKAFLFMTVLKPEWRVTSELRADDFFDENLYTDVFDRRRTYYQLTLLFAILTNLESIVTDKSQFTLLTSSERIGGSGLFISTHYDTPFSFIFQSNRIEPNLLIPAQHDHYDENFINPPCLCHYRSFLCLCPCVLR